MVREQHLMCQLKGVGIRSKQKCLRRKEERNKVGQKIPLLPVLDDILKIQEVLLYKDERKREHLWDYSSRIRWDKLGQYWLRWAYQLEYNHQVPVDNLTGLIKH